MPTADAAEVTMVEHSVMNKINPLELPEIRLSIAEYLKKPDLVRCLRVCWSWHDTFLPLVWENLSVDNSDRVGPSQDAPMPEVLRSYHHLVKDLNIVDCVSSVDWDNGLEKDRAMGGFYFEEFAREVARKRWPRLTSLRMYGQWTEEDTCLIIEGMQRVKKIDLDDTFGPLTFQALQRHFNNLVELQVETFSEAASKLLQNIMCSCPALKMLKGGSVLAKDVVEGKPWVCLSLESLSICFMFSDAEQHLQPLIFECLAKLTRLEHLYSCATRTPFREKYPIPLQFRLQCGLDALSGLWRMASFFPGYDSPLGEDELRWMLVHWKELISVTAGVHINDLPIIELKNLFKSLGIKLQRL
ncbi:hypothetical protein EDD21DRAFT_350866 [Dissophora ornata]|nr:hypothetical protein EDD21DRAFT_350866 [Dissophora ornata]